MCYDMDEIEVDHEYYNRLEGEQRKRRKGKALEKIILFPFNNCRKKHEEDNDVEM